VFELDRPAKVAGRPAKLFGMVLPISQFCQTPGQFFVNQAGHNRIAINRRGKYIESITLAAGTHRKGAIRK
jgi:hypothetical protein